MISANTIQISDSDSFRSVPTSVRRLAASAESGVLTDIYQEDINIAVWQRRIFASLQEFVKELLISNPSLHTSMIVTPQSALSSVREVVGDANQCGLSEDIAELVDMFCCLFDLSNVGLRLRALDAAMCPKFHVDRVPCRLVTTYHGPATQWLPHQRVDRTKLGPGSGGLSDSQSGLFQNESDIQQLSCGDVALFKGELWKGNENAGLVHRSPAINSDRNRLLLTLDFNN